MAVARSPITCPHCGVLNHFRRNRSSKMQRLMYWVGDNGGTYPTICKSCGKSLYKWTELTPEERKELKESINKMMSQINNKKSENP